MNPDHLAKSCCRQVSSEGCKNSKVFEQDFQNTPSSLCDATPLTEGNEENTPNPSIRGECLPPDKEGCGGFKELENTPLAKQAPLYQRGMKKTPRLPSKHP